MKEDPILKSIRETFARFKHRRAVKRIAKEMREQMPGKLDHISDELLAATVRKVAEFQAKEKTRG